ncbi:MAG: hypothetical protein ACI4R9_01320 [Kiritimatiellia bacterium]
MEQTPSRLNAMVVAVQVEGGACLKANVARMQVLYSAALKEIRDRLERERGAAE